MNASNAAPVENENEAPISRTQRFLVIACLYLVSDIGFSFFWGGLTTILLDAGVAKSTVGLIALLGLLYFVRFGFAPIVDRCQLYRSGHYKSWIVATQILLVAALILLAGIDPIHHRPHLLALMAGVLLLSAFHDVAINGLAVRILKAEERGFGNGIQIAAGSASFVLGSGGALLVYNHYGWTLTLLLLAAIFIIPLLVMGLFHEPCRIGSGNAVQWNALASFFKLPARRIFTLLVIPSLLTGLFLLTAVAPAILLDAHWDLQRIAVVQNTLAPIAGVAASLMTGYAINRFGRKGVLGILMTTTLLSLVAMWSLASGGGWLFVDSGAVIALNVCNAALLTWIATIAMDFSRPEHAATDFSLQISMAGLLRVTAMSIGMGLIPALGYKTLLLASLVLAAIGAGIAMVWASRQDAVHNTLANGVNRL